VAIYGDHRNPLSESRNDLAKRADPAYSNFENHVICLL